MRLEVRVGSVVVKQAKFEMHTVLRETMETQQPSRPDSASQNNKKNNDITDIDCRVKCWNLKQDRQLSKIKFNVKMLWTEPK